MKYLLIDFLYHIPVYTICLSKLLTVKFNEFTLIYPIHCFLHFEHTFIFHSNCRINNHLSHSFKLYKRLFNPIIGVRTGYWEIVTNVCLETDESLHLASQGNEEGQPLSFILTYLLNYIQGFPRRCNNGLLCNRD